MTLRKFISARLVAAVSLLAAAILLFTLVAGVQVVPSPQVVVVVHGESKLRPEDCRAILFGPGVNQP